ncbi:MAG: acyl-CoA thioesterase [Steroidobacteraceae bacterium]
MTTARALLNLEQVTDRRFRSTYSQANYQGAIFGGQALAQALAAAQRTVAMRLPHTCTGYFLRAGAVAEPIDYEVDLVRDGRRYAARRVLASQAGKPIFDLLCSFHDAEPGFAHQQGDAADVPLPEDLMPVLEFVRAHVDRLPRQIVGRHEQFHAIFPIELRLADPERVFFGAPNDLPRTYWFRMASAEGIEDASDHRCLLAFMSDYWLASAATAPHRSPASVLNDVSVTSLNHSIWFHGPVRADEWLLCRTDSPWAGEGRGMARGLIYDRRGRMVASVAQETSLRLR